MHRRLAVTMFPVTVLGAAVAMASCGGSTPAHNAAPPTTTTPAPTTAAPTTSTTVWAPTAPQPSPDAAGARLISAWAAGNRSLALTVASPTAVATLFAVAYPAGYLQPRGCTAGVNPGTCTYRNTKTNGIYEVGVTSGAGGWYVSSVTPET